MKRLILLALSVLLFGLGGVLPAEADGNAALSLDVSNTSGYGGDEITLTMYMTAASMGGLQMKIAWNSGYLTYVEGSAEFAKGFADNAMISQVNAEEGCIRLVYGNTNGYTAREAAIFTARFRLTEGVEGSTYFEIADAKMSDATADVKPMEVSVSGASVHTQTFNAGAVSLSLEMPNPDAYYPCQGEPVKVQVVLGTSGADAGSVQGTIEYDADVLALESASFTKEAEDAAVAKSMNTGMEGKVSFVYASVDSCPQSALIDLCFRVIDPGDGYTCLNLTNVKATNADAERLEWMECSVYGVSIYPQAEARHVIYTMQLAPDVKCSDEVITVELHARGITIGGMQGTLTYNPDQMEYVAQSAAFTKGFASGADVKMINDRKSGQLQLVYANADGFTPDGGAILTAQFRLLSREENLTPVMLTALKTTDANQTNVQVIESAFVQAIDWRFGLHQAAEDAAVEASCTQTGLTEGRHCAECGEVLKAQEAVPAKGHEWDAGVMTLPPTATEEGVNTFTCTRCGETRTEAVPPTGVMRSPGDVNQDGGVNIFDALLILQHDVGWDVEAELLNADVNADGHANIFDALLILQYDVGWQVELL